MRQPERRASSTSLTPSTPTNPFCVGRPPRRATRNSLSQRLSRLVRSAAPFAGRALRAIFPEVAITVEGSKFSVVQANPQAAFRADLLTPSRDPKDFERSPNHERSAQRCQTRGTTPASRPYRYGRDVFFAVLCFPAGCGDFISCDLDGSGDNSSISTAPSCSPSKIREDSCGYP